MSRLIFFSFLICVIFVFAQINSVSAQSDSETYPYVVLKKYDKFEIRNYESSLFTAVDVPSDKYRDASSRGFSLLAGYIFGANDRNEKIAMTSPVSMSLNDTMTMMFMVPKKFDKESLPEPNESSIQLREEPAKMMAAITFGGWADDEKIAQYKAELIKVLKAEDIAHTDRFYFYGYNAPYVRTNRRNEVVVELEQ